MDSELWASRLAAAKRQYILQHQQNNNSQLDRLSFDDIDSEEEIRPDFPCPYCYEDYDIVSLCFHLEDEHPFESKVTLCPICSVRVSRDMLNHITLQHGHLFKRRRRLRRVAILNSQALSLLGRHLREAHLQVLLRGGGCQSSNPSTSNAATDLFLSSLMFNFPASEADEITKSMAPIVEDTFKKNLTSIKPRKPSFDSSLSREEREQKTMRAEFVQDLLLSTLFGG
ncbi:hypothetical protein MKX01_014283 [Papaver californicum]|nr:hypothetical protein MKX01_014283 [Papaver californicum]